MSKVLEKKTFKIRTTRYCDCCSTRFHPGATMTRRTIEPTASYGKGKYNTHYCPMCEDYLEKNPDRLRDYGYGMYLEFGTNYRDFRIEFFRNKD